MPVKNYFPVFHKLKTGAYSYVWTEKCERLLPKHYKDRCLEYMLTESKPVHWKPDPRKYRLDEYGVRHEIQNHPILVKYPIQCNYGLWAGEGIVQCYLRKVRSKKYLDTMTSRVAKFYPPVLTERLLYSEILGKWYKIPCTNRAMDQIDDAFGLDYYILQTCERDINSKLGMDLKRFMLLQLCKDAEAEKLSKDRQAIFNRYKQFMVPEEEAEWVGLSIQEALEKAEHQLSQRKPTPLKDLITSKYLAELEDFKNQSSELIKDRQQDDTEENSQLYAGSRDPVSYMQSSEPTRISRFLEKIGLAKGKEEQRKEK